MAQPLAHIVQAQLGQPPRLRAMRAVFQAKQLGHFVEAEAQALCRLDELEPRQIGAAVAADAAGRSPRLAHQPAPLVVAHRLDTYAGGFGERTDCHCWLVHA